MQRRPDAENANVNTSVIAVRTKQDQSGNIQIKRGNMQPIQLVTSQPYFTKKKSAERMYLQQIDEDVHDLPANNSARRSVASIQASHEGAKLVV
jgi:hypothetical protein